MVHITSVEFHNADTMSRKGFLQAFHSLLKQMLRAKRAGDSVKIHFDDGSSHDYVISNATITGNHEGWLVEVHPGVEA